MPSGDVTELRLVVTATEFEESVRLYREWLGLSEIDVFSSRGAS